MVKLDLQDAYTVLLIHPNSRPFLVFENQGIIYQYKALNFGLNVAPRIFSKILRYAIEPSRRQVIRLVYYLDDICLLSQDAQDLTRTTHKEYLGFEFNTMTMKIKVSELKIRKLMQRIKQALSPIPRSCRWIASLLGKITAMLPAVGEALLHIRHLQRNLSISLHQEAYNWEKNCTLSTQAREELTWWTTL